MAQAALGKEDAACARLVRTGLVKDAFCPRRQTLRRVKGVWTIFTDPVWPGYVLATPAAALGDKDLAALRAAGWLSAAESQLIDRLCGSMRTVLISEGVIENGRLHVSFGPLKGLEPLVKKIDRHRRMAWLELPGAGPQAPARRMGVALEVTSKT